MNKKIKRIRRGLKTKARARNSIRPCLIVFRSSSHIYSQIVVRELKGDRVLVSASTIDKELKAKLADTKTKQAQQVGLLLAERAKKNNVTDVSFDRGGNKYHGRVKALADGAREGGLNF